MSDEVSQELYKKYRPKRWEELVGQQKVARSLQSAVLKNRIGVGLALLGQHGCGKTSSAFLLAKSLNCLNLGDDANPCNECEVCKNIDNHTQIGVTYISMANKGSVDDVRELTRNARNRQPIKRPIIILDEVHNLSKAAFDALLIPLEDNQMPSVFVLCSTEPDKIPSTIMSRVQSRRFSLVSSDDMIPFIHHILEEEGKTLSDDLILEAVKRGRGSVRDTLTATESLLLSPEFSSSESNDSLVEAISERDLAKILKVVAQASSEGEDCRIMSERLFSDMRDLMLYASGAKELAVVSLDNPVKTIKQMGGFRGIKIVQEEISDAITRMSTGVDARIQLEIALVKVTSRLNRLVKALKARSED